MRRIPPEFNDRRLPPPPPVGFHHHHHHHHHAAAANLYAAGEKQHRAWTPGVALLMSTRWSPTPEQLQSLEEMYRHGVRTPSAEQIQQIVAKLRRFGRIEGKNVFYWFQNHKAREKQRKRRRLELIAAAAAAAANKIIVDTPEKQSGTRKKCYGGVHQVPSNTTTTHWKYSAAAGSMDSSWTQLDLNSCIFTNNNSTAQQKVNSSNNGGCEEENETSFIIKDTHHTLELFPVRRCPAAFEDDGGGGAAGKEEEEDDCGNGVSRMAIPVTNQFFEFLPTRDS